MLSTYDTSFEVSGAFAKITKTCAMVDSTINALQSAHKNRNITRLKFVLTRVADDLFHLLDLCFYKLHLINNQSDHSN